MESAPTQLYLPSSFSYPVKVVSIDATPSSSVERGTRLLSYSFVYLSTAPGSQPETRFGTWDSNIEGTIDSWNFKVGDVISKNKARDRPAVLIVEPCKHGIQIGGLCALCGKDMTNADYTGLSDASRASIQMTHSAFGPTVSFEEAQRIEKETAEHLLKSRKLSLIVDLTKPSFMQQLTQLKTIREGLYHPHDSDNDSDDSLSDSDDECNPNWEALKDVKKFRLGPETFGPPSMRGGQRAKGKNKLVENEGCMYYIKPRPGWKEFLKQTAGKYEMHVYTMGTRAYAEEVCAAIDPDGSIFGGRILSRDESGSLTQKSLQRLFPCDTSMVVIIDDRADVWEWSPNLIKVIPYDFFVGIGDINSSFLPKIEPLTLSSPPKPPNTAPANGNPDQPVTEINDVPVPDASLNLSTEAELAQQEANAMLTRNNAALDAQVEQRPLAKKQEELLEASEGESSERQPTPAADPMDQGSGGKEETPSPSPRPEKPHRKALLKNDDHELDRVGKLLNEVHTRFFGAYDARAPENSRRKMGPGSRAYDVTRIIPRLRSDVLDGVHILFSSVIPLDTRPETTEIWKMAHMFGARCSTELNGDVTHVVAAKKGTVKVDMARKRGGTKIVWLSWFTDSVALWRRQDETPYLLDEPTAASSSATSPNDAHQISSDPEPDADDWDEVTYEAEPQQAQAPSGLQLNDINWADINDEVEAAMNESDDETDGGQSVRSEDDWADETNSMISTNTPQLKRKRLRSVTPSESMNGAARSEEDLLRSPLAKRKKLAAERFSGDSRLKETLTAADLVGSPRGTASNVNTPRDDMEYIDEGEDGEDEDEDGDEDDFLARELEEEWG
ncbi:hypothetical protein BDQ17DRAFT_1420544 [Cyathus striatus]|nr:hypothetical protein BDQ17DRAFT_1420544 [Cyathus striatus]